MHDERVIAAKSLFKEQIRGLLEQVQKKKRLVNELCEQLGEPPDYVLDDPADAGGGLGIGPGEFFTKPLATVVTMILEKRRAAGLHGPATVDEIYSLMIQGGFQFDAKTDATAKRSLSIAVSKNTKFVKLPSDHIALADWYDLPKQRSQNGGTKDDEKKSVESEKLNEAAKEDDRSEFVRNFGDAATAEEKDKTRKGEGSLPKTIHLEGNAEATKIDLTGSVKE